MSDLTSKLIELIKNNKSLNEISEELKLSNKQIYNILSMISKKGFEFSRKYYDDGNIFYIPKNIQQQNNNTNIVSITTKNDIDNFSAIVISDLHIGNSLQRIDLVKYIYEYCSKEDIHNIFICGDLIDGTFGQVDKILKNTYDQIDFLLKNYPFDKNILNYVVLGDHDLSALEKDFQNIEVALNNYRHDIISTGYQCGKINIKLDQIILRHRIDTYNEQSKNNLPNLPSLDHQLILNGHSHHVFEVKIKKTNAYVNIPSLSDIRDMNQEIFPSAVKMDIKLYNNIFKDLTFTQLLIVDNKLYPINTIKLNFNSSKKHTDMSTIDFSNKQKTKHK